MVVRWQQDGGERQRRRRDDGRQRRQRQPSARWRQPLAAAAPLGDEDVVEEVLLPKMVAWEEENSWSLGFFTT